MEPILIVANILSLIGNTFFTLSSIMKGKRKIMSFQMVNFVLGTTSEVLSKAWAGFAQDSMNLAKTIVLLFVKSTKKGLIVTINIICMTIAFVLGIILNIILSNSVWYGYPPILSSLILSICTLVVFVKKNTKASDDLLIKGALIFNGVCWSMYGYFVKLYPIMIFNCITIILSIISFVIYFKRKKTNN